MPEISRHATVERGAQLADDVCVGPFAYIGPHAKLGGGCIVDAGATIVGHTALGAKCHVFPQAVVGITEEGSEGHCLVGQANHIREYVTISAGTEQPTLLGDDNLLMIGCRVGPGTKLGNHCILSNYTQVDNGATIEDYVGTSAFTFVGRGVTVGTYTYVVGFTGVDASAPPYAMVQGFPFRVRGVNSEKLRRCGFGDEDIRALKEAFRELFNHTGARVDGTVLGRLAEQTDLNPHVRRLVDMLSSQTEKGRQA